MSATQPPEFDVTREELIRELQSWWDEESLSFDAAVEGGGSPPLGSSPLDDGLGAMPVVDSKKVIRASPIVERYLGKKLPPKLIRRGGYFSFSDFIEDILPKLKDLSEVVTEN